jgi:hypothetical protein
MNSQNKASSGVTSIMESLELIDKNAEIVVLQRNLLLQAALNVIETARGPLSGLHKSINDLHAAIRVVSGMASALPPWEEHNFGVKAEKVFCVKCGSEIDPRKKECKCDLCQEKE